jgi:hypothetical protein
VSKFGDEETITKYVKEQCVEKEYKVIHKVNQLALFGGREDTPLLAAGFFITELFRIILIFQNFIFKKKKRFIFLFFFLFGINEFS